LGLMLSVTIILAGSSLESPVAWIIFVLAAISVGVLNINAAWIVGGAAITGWLVSNYL
ncbi:MAG: chromate transporter, partial [Ignavibacteriales bacterium]|nr:chromate transporter [Ignavibacteriales bacterium]